MIFPVGPGAPRHLVGSGLRERCLFAARRAAFSKGNRMATGTITAIRLDGGYGFICPTGHKPREADLFFHHRDLCDDLEFSEQLVERQVQFDQAQSQKGPCARNVRAAR